MLKSITVPKFKKELLISVTKRIEELSKKKIPKSEKYPYEVHDSLTVLGEDSGFEQFYLVGDNWVSEQSLPILVVIGCNDWKFGFVADYFADFRVAYLPRKKIGLSAYWLIGKIKKKLAGIAIWGYTEKPFLSKQLSNSGLPIWRLEDGFIRSAELGAAHSTPYSLVIDKTGFYYNCYEKSDIETLLNNYDFDSNYVYVEQSKYAMKLISSLGLSKYNPPVLERDTSIKLKKRVLVLGQVDNDASIRFGNPDNWTNEELVKLAYYENPNAEIVYRPHPEVFRGFQKSKFKSRRIEKIASLVSPEIDINSCLDNADQVYTISSLTGLEALIRGKNVTVVGMPFYSGWGLTDDRASSGRRGRELTLLQLFYAVYILYPKYLGNLNDGYVGLLATCYRIAADRDELLDKQVKETLRKPIEEWPSSQELINFAKTDKWAALLVAKRNKNDSSGVGSILATMNHADMLSVYQGNLYRKLAPYFVLGCLKENVNIDKYLAMIRGCIPQDQFNAILLDMDKYFPGPYLLKHWSWLYSHSGVDQELFVQEHLASHMGYMQHSEAKSSVDGVVNEAVAEVVSFEDQACAAIMESVEADIQQRNLTDLVLKIKYLFLSGRFFFKVAKAAATISDLMFDYDSLTNFSKLISSVDPHVGNKYASLSEFRSYGQKIIIDKENHLRALSSILLYRPDNIGPSIFNLEKFEEYFSELDHKVLISQVFMDSVPTAFLAQAHITLENFAKAETFARKLVMAGDSEPTDNEIVILSQAFSYNHKVDKAIDIVKTHMQKNLTPILVTELMRLYVLKGYYRESLILMEKAIGKGLVIGEMHRRKAYFGNQMIYKALETFTEIGIRNNVASYYKNKYYLFDSSLVNSKVFLLAIFGPGDEIRFASIYSRIFEYLGCSELSVACSPRLHSLFSRSFRKIKFVSVKRPRNSDRINLDDYSEVPGSDIISVVDNNAVGAIDSADSIFFVTDLLHRLLPSKQDFSGAKYLVPDEQLVSGFAGRLPKQHMLVGLSWRSSLTTSARNEHYLSIQQLVPLFEIEGIKFVNLQYDDCDHELEWIESKYPGKIINFEDVDQYNDFESVAAIITCLDLVISPATTVAELAGSLGCKTWLFSNSSEIDWRKKDGNKVDIWHESVEIVDVDDKGNKEALVIELEQKLVRYVEAGLAEVTTIR